MDTKTLHRAFGILVFALALVTYMLTVQPSVPFWDCGEFSAAAIQQQVPHPPGAPLFLMVGKVFHVLLPFGDEGWRINLVSVLSSAFCVLLLYLISVIVINNFRGGKPKDFGEGLMVYGSSFVGAAAFIFSDTFWFNAVESEVYAASTLFVAIIVWLIMRWHEEADNPGNERYLLMIAYLIGLSIGVHLLAVLTIFPIALIIYFRKNEPSLLSFLIMGVAAVAAFGMVYPGIVKWLPAMIDGNWTINAGKLDRIVAGFLVLFTAAFIFWSWRNNRNLLVVVGTCFVLIFVGYSTYTHILLRANAHPPMNENNPNDLSSLVSYLGREQYGDAPMWPRRYDTRPHIQRNFNAYGEWYPPDRERVEREDGVVLAVPVFNQVNAAGEFNYLLDYQASHMYGRYFAWNFIGRVSDIQDAPWTKIGADEDYWLYGVGSFAEHFPARFFALPLLFGLLGLFFQAFRDPRMAIAYFVLFLLTGIIAALQQNQQNPQPRERDYFYTGSFMVFAMWIGLGVYFIAEQLRRQREAGYAPMVAVILILSFVAVPANMAWQGWAIHDRSGNYLPFDYAYNILQSVEENAIVFTNGDNDTFPVWYLQDVAGVRRDVRIVNLSLGNTLWYVDQLKNERPWTAEKIPLSFSDASIQTRDENSPVALTYYIDRARQMEVSVSPDILRQYTDDPAIINSGKMSWQLIGDPYGSGEPQEYVIRVQDQLVTDILKTTRFERPVYYSMSVGPDAYAGLEDFFRLEGMCLRICPVSQNNQSGFFACNEAIMDQTLLNIIPGNDYHKQQHYGWKMRNLNNPDVYYDESNRRPIPSYRNIYLNYATWQLNQGNKEKAVAVMDTLDKYISSKMFPMPFATEMQIAEIYSRAGAERQAQHFAQMALESSDFLLQPENRQLWNTRERYTYSYNPAQIAADASTMLGNYEAAMDYWQKYGESIGRGDDPSLQGIIDQLRIEKYESEGKYSEAIAEAEKVIESYRSSGHQYLNALIPQIEFQIMDLKRKAGFPVGDSLLEGGADAASGGANQ